MKSVICVGPPTTGKTSVLRHMTGKFLAQGGRKPAFLKLDVQYADEDEVLAEESASRRGKSTPASSAPITAM